MIMVTRKNIYCDPFGYWKINILRRDNKGDTSYPPSGNIEEEPSLQASKALSQASLFGLMALTGFSSFLNSQS